MGETHSEYESLFRDQHMLNVADKDVKYLSTSKYSVDVDVAGDQRVLAEYSDGNWHTESQIQVDGEWWVASRNHLERVPDEKDQWTFLGRVERTLGLFSNLSLWERILFAPVYAILIAVHCLKGENVVYHIIDKDSDPN